MHWVVLGLLFLAAPVADGGEIYKTVDEHGNVVFTDRPSPRQREQAEPVDVQPPNTFPSDEATVPSGGSLPRRDGYDDVQYRLAISAPRNEETVRSNSGDLDVVTFARPSLRGQHRLVLVLDGQALDIEPDGTTWHLFNLDRGTHDLMLEVVDPNQNRAVAQSARSVFHLQRASVRRRAGP